jgi:LAGLIDADG endonuclease
MVNLIVESQSAGNLIYLDILMILREYKLEIICSNSILLIPNINSNFISYLTGLIEGDGTIIVPKTERSPKGKINYPSIQIVFHKKDLPLALQIQKKLGFGSLISKKGVNAYTLYVNDKKGILKLVNLLNGQMKTPKINSLYKLIEWLNKKNPQLNLNKLSLNNQPLIKNAWFSGFIESDGQFSVRTSFTGKYPKIECKFEVSQRQKDHLGYNNKLFLNTIANFLNVDLKNTRENTSHPQYRLRTTNLKSNLILINYLNKFPLFGSKFLDYKDWERILNLFNPRFKYKENINNVLSLKSEMNDKRAVFTWNHLNNFY